MEPTINTLFYELIKSSIGLPWKQKIPTEQEWNVIFRMAKSHAISGICFNGIQKLYKERSNVVSNLPLKLRMQWLGMAAQIQQQNELVSKRCTDVHSKVTGSGFRCCVLKGQGVALLYSKELQNLRQSGDIDLWICGNMDVVLEKIHSLEVNIHDIHLVHATADFFEDVPVETHFRPSWMYNPILDRKLQKFFAEQASEQFANYDESVGYAYPTIYFNLVHSMVHINRHIFEEGIGLRQLIDYYYILQHSTQQERSDAYKVLCSVGLKKFVGAVMYVLKQVFVLENDLMLCEPNSALGIPLLDSIIVGGNFGKALGLKHGRNKLEKGLLQWKHNLQLMLPYANEAMWIPFFQVWHYVWRKKHGYL